MKGQAVAVGPAEVEDIIKTVSVLVEVMMIWLADDEGGGVGITGTDSVKVVLDDVTTTSVTGTDSVKVVLDDVTTISVTGTVSVKVELDAVTTCVTSVNGADDGDGEPELETMLPFWQLVAIYNHQPLGCPDVARRDPTTTSRTSYPREPAAER